MKTASCMVQPEEGRHASAAVVTLGPWFHNLHLPDGTQTAPNHPLGDFPAYKWREVAPEVPADLNGWTALDIGCNAGFYSIELARRGAHVVALDREDHFLRQARWAIGRWDLLDRIDLRLGQVYDLAHTRERFDLVLFMGVFYHLRYPLLALDIVAALARRQFVFQTLTLPGLDAVVPPEDQGLDAREVMLAPGWPKMAFIEKSLGGDPTNWWAPNHACVESMLRSTGLRVVARPGHEIYVCAPAGPDVAAVRSWPVEELLAATGRGPGIRPAGPPPAASSLAQGNASTCGRT